MRLRLLLMACLVVLPWGMSATGLDLVRESEACSCSGTSPEGDFRRAAAVFAGVPRKIRHLRPRIGKQPVLGRLEVEFEVTHWWKGGSRRRVTIRTIDQSSACGYPFSLGRHYLVYGFGSRWPLSAGLCTRTGVLSAALWDLRVLGPAKGLGEWPQIARPTFDTLRDSLASRDEEVRSGAGLALAHESGAEGDGIGVLVDVVRGRRVGDAEAALYFLAGAPARPPALEDHVTWAFRHGSSATRKAALRALRRVSSPDTFRARIAEALESDEPGVMLEAHDFADLLSESEFEAIRGQTGARLLGLLAHPDPDTRIGAMRRLAATYPELADRFRDDLVRIAKEDPDEMVRHRATWILERLGVPAGAPPR